MILIFIFIFFFFFFFFFFLAFFYALPLNDSYVHPVYDEDAGDSWIRYLKSDPLSVYLSKLQWISISLSCGSNFFFLFFIFFFHFFYFFFFKVNIFNVLHIICLKILSQIVIFVGFPLQNLLVMMNFHKLVIWFVVSSFFNIF